MLLEIIKNKLVSVKKEEIEIGNRLIKVKNSQNLDDFYDSFLLEGFNHKFKNDEPNDFNSLYRIRRNGKCIHICERDIKIVNRYEYDVKLKTEKVKVFFNLFNRHKTITIKTDKKYAEIERYKEKGFSHNLFTHNYYTDRNDLTKKVYCIIYENIIEELTESDFKELEERLMHINNELVVKSLKEF